MGEGGLSVIGGGGLLGYLLQKVLDLSVLGQEVGIQVHVGHLHGV